MVRQVSQDEFPEKRQDHDVLILLHAYLLTHTQIYAEKPVVPSDLFTLCALQFLLTLTWANYVKVMALFPDGIMYISVDVNMKY